MRVSDSAASFPELAGSGSSDRPTGTAGGPKISEVDDENIFLKKSSYVAGVCGSELGAGNIRGEDTSCI